MTDIANKIFKTSDLDPSDKLYKEKKVRTNLDYSAFL